MSSPHELTPELAALEAALAGLVPRQPAFAHPEFWYQAGVLAERRRAARRLRAGWYGGGLATAAGLILAVVGLMQARELGRLRGELAAAGAHAPRSAGPLEFSSAPVAPAERRVEEPPARPPFANDAASVARLATGPRVSLDDFDALLEAIRPVASRGWVTGREASMNLGDAPTNPPGDQHRPADGSQPQSAREWLEVLLSS